MRPALDNSNDMNRRELLKDEKEAFVTGHEGTGVEELLIVSLAAPIGIWLWTIVCRDEPVFGKRMLGEVFLILFPMLLVQTSFLYPWGVIVMTMEVLCATFLLSTKRRRQDSSPKKNPPQSTRRAPSITCYRSSVMFMTCVAILAVDFPLFPRRFAKTETQGYGLMDLGAGSFVVSAGLLWRPTSQHVKRILSLVGMGLLRLVANKGVNYQEHVSEYGVHWNFFLTLAVVMPLATACLSVWSETTVLTSVSIIMIVYQYTLRLGLQEYIETGPRQCSSPKYIPIWICKTVAANREGVLGCIGYLWLFVASHFIGFKCLQTKNYCIGDTIQMMNRKEQQAMLFGFTAVLWVLQVLLEVFIPCSRRSTNLTFCVWVLAHNILMLALIHTVAVSAPPIFESINRHGLLVFIVANLLTGLVNLSINTLQVSDSVAFWILAGYLSAICGFPLLLDRFVMPHTKSNKQDREEESKGDPKTN